MPPIAFVAAALVLLIATGTAALLVRARDVASEPGRYDTIDGLRGYLALFVFVHHSSIWYSYSRGGQWQVPPSNLFTLFGEAGVALFFMITGFLFFGKLLEGRRTRIDWAYLYVSRFLRLAPLYLLAMLLLFLVVAQQTHWTLHAPLARVLADAADWIAFTVRGNPALNGFREVGVVAGVTWTLPYEWFFYFSLPLLALLLSIRPPVASLALALGASILVIIGFWRPGLAQSAAFLGGIASAVLVRSRVFRQFSRAPGSSFLAVASLVLLVMLFPSARSFAATVLLTVAFAIVAGGCTMFGTLTTTASRLLGDIAYSMYLLHGIVLFVLFRVLLGDATHLSVTAHWVVILLLTPVLVGACFITYGSIEKPAMSSVPSVTRRLKAALSMASSVDEEQRAAKVS